MNKIKFYLPKILSLKVYIKAALVDAWIDLPVDVYIQVLACALVLLFRFVHMGSTI